jgi:hypothetical protein
MRGALFVARTRQVLTDALAHEIQDTREAHGAADSAALFYCLHSAARQISAPE